MTTSDRLVDIILVACVWLIAGGLLMTTVMMYSGCATVKPCLSGKVEKRVLMKVFNDPDVSEMVIDGGDSRRVLTIMADPESVVDFLAYVERLEADAHMAETCHK